MARGGWKRAGSPAQQRRETTEVGIIPRTFDRYFSVWEFGLLSVLAGKSSNWRDLCSTTPSNCTQLSSSKGWGGVTVVLRMGRQLRSNVSRVTSTETDFNY